ncbi:tRNA lysidine(34) synthetase TilS [Hoeflea sp. WL0058]|uniref:tRNA(Ile)-lysidine synthase n=1 Tax=Flavimaribacter sediminis TaxID=2865987 RepID=A0AAE3D1P0_9HYPH|nr:tRNA lysidine(34) synthetase TilS [Flavimaribacter sediminis]MBW8639084.1 tRNA lysidine(34) synthetase TilS [Flavimaribacter sediminis]
MSPEEAVRIFVNRLGPDRPLAVAISGGGDSIALLNLLVEARNRRQIACLLAITVDHGLRDGSDAEARQVAAWCAALDVDHVIATWKGLKPATGLQNEARLARYRLVRETAMAHGVNCVATAHNADDQVETVQMRGMRNPGRGLSGMAQSVLYQRDFWILRPLLSVRRSDLRRYLENCGKRWIDDPSNEDRRFERVRIRQDMRRFQDDIAKIEESASERTAGALEIARVIEGAVSTPHPALARMEIPPRDERAWRQALAFLLAIMGGRQHLPGAELMDRVGQFALVSAGGRMTAGRCVIEKHGDLLSVYRENRNVPTVRLEPGDSQIWDGRYEIANPSPGRTMIVAPRGVEEDELEMEGNFTALPKGLLARALPALPACSVVGDPAGESPPAEIARILAPFDLFLPEFDMTIARTCANLFGAPDYSAPPLRI